MNIRFSQCNSIFNSGEILYSFDVSSALTCCICYSPISLTLIQAGTHSASVDTQRELQSAAHTFYQQVVRVLKQRVLLEREHPGLFIVVSHVRLSFKMPSAAPCWLFIAAVFILVCM